MKDLVPYSASPDSTDRPMELGKGASGGAHLFRDRKVQIFYMQSRVWDRLVRPIEIKFFTNSRLWLRRSSDEAERSMTPSERQKVSDEHCVVRSISQYRQEDD